MKAATLLALPEGMEIDQIQITKTGLVATVSSTAPSSSCPLCSQPSSHVHSGLTANVERCSLCWTPASVEAFRAQILLP